MNIRIGHRSGSNAVWVTIDNYEVLFFWKVTGGKDNAVNYVNNEIKKLGYSSQIGKHGLYLSLKYHQKIQDYLDKWNLWS